MVRIDAPESGCVYVERAGSACLDPLRERGETVVVGNHTVRTVLYDATSGLDEAALEVDGTPRVVKTGPGALGDEFLWRAGEERLGLHNVTIAAVDIAGNAARTPVVAVRTIPTEVAGVERTLAGLPSPTVPAAPGLPQLPG